VARSCLRHGGRGRHLRLLDAGLTEHWRLSARLSPSTVTVHWPAARTFFAPVRDASVRQQDERPLRRSVHVDRRLVGVHTSTSWRRADAAEYRPALRTVTASLLERRRKVIVEGIAGFEVPATRRNAPGKQAAR
jgi:hypothetical protein